MTNKCLAADLSILTATTVAILLAVSDPLAASAEDVLLECSATATDERGIDSCLSLLSEQSQTTLSSVEQSWRRALDSIALPGNIESANNSLSADSTAQVQTTVSQSDGSKVIAIVNDTALDSGVQNRGDETLNVDNEGEPSQSLVNQSVDIKERFGFIPALYSSYRDQHCAWEASLFGADRVDMHYKACITDLNRSRVSMLNRSLAEIRSAAVAGRKLRGYYVKTNTGATFQACDRKVDWWVTGTQAVLAALDRRYADASTRNLASVSDRLIYAELSGTIQVAPQEGPGADYQGALNVEGINILRPLVPADCNIQQPPSTTDVVTLGSVQSAATVDDFASAGFLYGYFNDWLAACSVTENSVCSAETDARFASDGEWQLRVDRSIEGGWRVQLMPVTDNEVIEQNLKLEVDGEEIYVATTFPEPMHLTLKQGVNIAIGEAARELIMRMRSGTETRFEWLDETGVMSELKFSLAGVTRALEFFDQSVR